MADLIPYWPQLIVHMDQVLIVEKFVRLYGARLSTYFMGRKDEAATKSDLKDFMGAIAAIAQDPDASAVLEAAQFKDGKRKITASLQFTTSQARTARETIEAQRREIEQKN